MHAESSKDSVRRRFRVAIIGCGRISVIHLETLARLANVEVVGLCDQNRELAALRARDHGVAGVHGDAAEMLRAEKPDSVHILTPPGTHRKLVELVCASGAHAYVEKPLASNEADALAMVEAAERAGVLLCPGHNRLFDPVFLEAARRIAAGEIGRVVSVRAEQGFTYESAAHAANIPWSYTYDWGVQDNLLTHPLYLASHFLEDPGPPQVVALDLGRVREAAVEEIRILIPASNAIAEVALSLVSAPERNRLEVIGTRGRLAIDLGGLNLVAERKSFLPSAVDRLWNSLSISAQLTRSVFGTAFGVATRRVQRYPGIRRLVAEFYRALGEGTLPPVLAADGVLNARQMEQVRDQCRAVAKRRTTLAKTESDAPGPRVLVSGGSGFVGARLVGRLAADGQPTRATTRSVARATESPLVEWVQGNLGDETSLRDALRGVETVYHCAALVGAPGTLEDYRAINVEGTRRLVELAAESGVRRFVYLSSIGVYGSRSRRRRQVDESAGYETRPGDRGYYTQTKLEAERELLEFASSHEQPTVVVLRPGTIYGPGAPLPVGRLKLPSPDSRPVVVGGGGVAMPLVWVDNVVDAMLAAAEADVGSGTVYNLVDSAELDQRSVARIIAAASGGAVRPLRLPYPAGWSAMLCLDLLGLARHGRLGTARYRLKRTLADMRMDSARARRELGWEPRVEPEEGLGRLLDNGSGPRGPGA